jgi:hypothetical protein
MDMEQDSAPTDEALRVPKRTTPTWEMELLLSGATVFALWQVAAAMAPLAAYLLPRVEGHLASLGGVLYIYLASGVIMIGLAFIIHLALRAHWVALVGMHSVFPQGLRVDRLRGGPIMRDGLRARWQDMEAAIEQADNRATVVFGLGIGVASVLIPITFAVVILYGLAAAACWTIGQPEATQWVFPILVLAFLLPFMGVQLVDRYFGERMARTGLAFRACTRLMGLYSRVGLGRDATPLVTLYSSNVGDGRGTLVVLSVMTLTLLIATASLLAQRMELGAGSFGDFPEPSLGVGNTMDGRHYASMHEPGDSPRHPYLPDPIVRGDYLRLVVPYMPGRSARHLAGCASSVEPDADAIGRAKAANQALPLESRRRDALLACYAKLHALRIDGQPALVAPEWYTDPRRDVRGLVFMVPVATLAAGRHELQLATPDPREPDSEDEAPLPDRIPFWR